MSLFVTAYEPILMPLGVRVVNFRWKLGFKSWPGHIVVFLGITCYPHRTTLYPGENSYHQIIRLNEMLRG